MDLHRFECLQITYTQSLVSASQRKELSTEIKHLFFLCESEGFLLYFPPFLVLCFFFFLEFSLPTVFYLTQVSLGDTEMKMSHSAKKDDNESVYSVSFLFYDYCYIIMLFSVIFYFCFFMSSYFVKKKFLDSSFQMWQYYLQVHRHPTISLALQRFNLTLWAKVYIDLIKLSTNNHSLMKRKSCLSKMHNPLFCIIR